MLPTEQFSENSGPIWKPQCWAKSPEVLQREAQVANFQNRAEIEHTALQTPGNAMAGSNPAEANEYEQKIDPSNPPEPDGSRAQMWHGILQSLRSTEPLAGTTRALSWSPAAEAPNPPA